MNPKVRQRQNRQDFRALCFTLWFAGTTLSAQVGTPSNEPPAAPLEGARAKTNAPESLEMNPALRQSSKLILTANLLTSAHGFQEDSPRDQWQVLFDRAQQQHLQKDYAQASRNFTAIIEGKAADNMKRSALIKLAVIAQEQDQLAKAQQILAQYLRRYPLDPSVPEVLLRQGLLYRQMGASTLALSKFYAVMTSALTLKHGSMEYYQRLVLHAQTEIAETHYLQGQYEAAMEFLNRLLKLDSADLNKVQIQFKLLRCLSALAKHEEVVAQGVEFLGRYAAVPEEPEVRFLLASSLKQLGRNKEALHQVLLLLQSQQPAPEKQETAWSYWQRRAGNQIANQMYQEADYLNALEIYSALALLDESPAWQFPVWYQMGLIYERLQQPEKASFLYDRIKAREKELASEASPGLKTVMDMAKWRNEFLNWQTQARRLGQTNAQLQALPPLSATR